MKKYFLIYSGLFLLFSCSKYKKSEFEKGIELKYNTVCKNSNICTINIRETTSFNWDKMYVFKTTASLEIINKTLGFNYPYFEDVAERIVFVKDNKIIYHDDYYQSFDGGIQNIIEFKLPDNLSYKLYDVNNAVFRIYKNQTENNDDYYFTLIQ
jgi:hypothetical protein